MRHGRLAYYAAQGLADREAGTPMAPDTIFRLYSMSKPVTAVALMTLYERGYFQLNDPVARFFPDWRNHQVWVSGEGAAMITRRPARLPTIRDVLAHTAGLIYPAPKGEPSDTPEIDAAYLAAGVGHGAGNMQADFAGDTLTAFVANLARVPLLFDPGTRWRYSYATDVCGALVESISGRPFADFLTEEIFGPLGMKDTGFFVPEAKSARLAANYRRAPDKSLALLEAPSGSPFLQPPSFASGGAGLVSTTLDYLRFCEMLRRGGALDGVRILGPRTIDLMRRNHLAGGRDLAHMAMGGFGETGFGGVGFGLGVAMTLDSVAAGVPGADDYYWGGAASTLFWVDPVEQMSVVFMTQLMPSGTYDFRGQLRSLVNAAMVD
jgi:CubicO group peptidase (beta-lactamase class C family)